MKHATLETIVIFVSIVSSQKEFRRDPFDHLVRRLYTEQHLSNLNRRILHKSSTSLSRHECLLSITLVIETCDEEDQRQALFVYGTLDALATKVAEQVVASGCCVDVYARAEYPEENNHVQEDKELLPHVLLAVSSIIWGSCTRGFSFCGSPSLKAVFGVKQGVQNPSLDSQPDRFGTDAAIDDLQILLPDIPFPAPRRTIPSSGSGRKGQVGPSTDTQSSVHEAPVIPWLVYTVRTEERVAKLQALWLLAIILSLGLITHSRAETFVWLLMPYIVKLLEKPPPSGPSAHDDTALYGSARLGSSQDVIEEQAPTVLSVFTLHNKELQKAAADAGAIKRLCQMLKETFDDYPDQDDRYWSPYPGRPAQPLEPFLSNRTRHVLEVRHAVFRALGALAHSHDSYRKVIIEQGIIPFAIKSMKKITSHGESTDSNFENSPSVMLAALTLIRSLSRSVATLRTSLMDAGITEPLFTLLENRRIDVVVAATAVITNLVLEFSPMREAIIEKGIVDVLCANARSMHAELRLNSVWALKHLVLRSPLSLRVDCLEKLGTEWLKQVLGGDDHIQQQANGHRARSTPFLSAPNAAHEQVDILNTIIPMSPLPLFNVSSDGEDVHMPDSSSPSSPLPSLSQQPSISQTTSWAQLSRPSESSSTMNVSIMDIDIQRQSLDFIRNTICAEGASEMVDHLLQIVGQQKAFEDLTEKIRFYSTSSNHKPPSPHIAIPTATHAQHILEVLIATLYILIHIAASNPRHKLMLIQRPALLRAITPLFDHTSREVRLPCCWIAINLTTLENGADVAGAKIRAREIVNVGWFEKLRAMEQGDAELDVRERAKTAVQQVSDRGRA